MTKRVFEFSYEVTGSITVDSEVIDRVDDEWREYLYNLQTPEEIIDMIAWNKLANNWGLPDLDGWADMDKNQAVVSDVEWFMIHIKEE